MFMQQQKVVKWLLFLSSNNVVKLDDHSHLEPRTERVTSVELRDTCEPAVPHALLSDQHQQQLLQQQSTRCQQQNQQQSPLRRCHPFNQA